MSIFELIFKKPRVVSCKQNHEIVCHNSVTPVNVVTSGWGWLLISTKLDNNWPGVKEYKSINDIQSIYFVPQGKPFKVVMYNCFGRTQLVIDPISANNELHEIVAPKKIDYKSVLFYINRILKSKSFTNKLANKHRFPSFKVGINLSSNIQLPENDFKLNSPRIVNNSCNLFTTRFNHVDFTNTIKLKPVSISNKIEAKNIAQD